MHHSRVLFVVLVLLPGALLANGATYGGSGSNVYLLHNDKVSMRREVVEMTSLDDLRGPIRVRCTFWFANGPDPASFQMGFPVGGYGDYVPIHDFTVHVDGVETATSQGRDSVATLRDARVQRYEQTVYLWPIHFAPDQECRVDVTYDLPAWSSSDLSLYNYSTGYTLTTGAAWKKPIGQCDLSLRLARPCPYPAIKANLPGFEFDGQTLRWRFENFRPSSDLWVQRSSGLAEKLAGRFTTPLPPGAGWNRECLEFEGLYDLEMMSMDEVAESKFGAQIELVRAEVRKLREEIRDGRGVQSLGELERLNVDYCEALLDILQPATSRDKFLAGLQEVQRRFW